MILLFLEPETYKDGELRDGTANVYPNPTNKVIKVIWIDSSSRFETNSGEAYIYNSKGQLVLTADYDEYNPKIDISNLTNGLYWVQLGSGETQIFVRGKFLVLK